MPDLMYAELQPTAPLHLAYGGVRFELLGHIPSDRMRGEHILPARTLGVADVMCSIERDPSLRRDSSALSIVAERVGHGLRLSSSCAVASIMPTGPRRFAASARCGSTYVDDVLGLVVAAVAELTGGLVLHAAAVEVDGRVVAFVGPSGAGKTTAAGLVPGARWYSRDRLVVHAHHGRWWAWPLVGGSDTPALMRSERGPLPLAAVLRVRQGVEVMLSKLRAAEAALAIRGAMLVPVHGSEESALTRALDLAASVPVGQVETVLGHPLGGLLTECDRWIQ